MKLSIVQNNPTVGSVAENANSLRHARAQAARLGADIVVASELFVTGYPPEDLVLKRAFIARAREVSEALIAQTKDGGPALVFGAPWVDNGDLYNSVIIADAGRAEVRHKVHLPNYAVFDEKRLFRAGPLPMPVELRGHRFGFPICEDVWFADVCRHLAEQGAEMFISPNGSPFQLGKHEQRLTFARKRCLENRRPLVYVNQVGGQDDLVFDGRSFVMNANGQLVWSAKPWVEDHGMINLVTDFADGQVDPQVSPFFDMYMAAVMGLRDYVEKNRFPGVLIGLSGGIDSALCAAMSVDALGSDRVHCIMLPSAFTSQESLDDAAACAKLLGVRLDTMPIGPLVHSANETLAPIFEGRPHDLTEENIQSRLRGLLLMAVSNKLGSMVVTTGNKSEVSVGYATLYGDMNGGYNPIKDIYKTDVFALARWRNEQRVSSLKGPHGLVIPEAIITKAPSAELRPDQKDADSLPPYDVLDGILRALVDHEHGFDEIVAAGYSADIVKRVEHLLYVSEYKRRQSAPGPKVGPRNFGRDRRYPITNGFRDARLKG